MESTSREAEFRAELAGLDETEKDLALQKAKALLREAREGKAPQPEESPAEGKNRR